MPAPKSQPIPAAPPVPSAAPRAAPVPEPAATPTAASQEKPSAPKTVTKVRVRTRHEYPIWVPHAGRQVVPGEVVELDDVHWVRRQIALGTLIQL